MRSILCVVEPSGRTRPKPFRTGAVCGRLLGALVIISSWLASHPPTLPGQSTPTASIPIWAGRAPGEQGDSPGRALPAREGETPPVTRIVGIERPALDIFLPVENPTGTAVLILPGGGFGKVVTDKEGSEAAEWLNELGIAAFVLRYRTNERKQSDEPAWRRPLQDAQRAVRLLRASAAKWGLKPERIGVLGFSAGGQVASMMLAGAPRSVYEPRDAVDQQPLTLNFALLIYPWRIYDTERQTLIPEVRIDAQSPPTFIVHTHDDASSSLGSVLVYAELKRRQVPAELHVYLNGGHGYGMRAVAGSQIGSWPARAAAWLRIQKLCAAAP